MGFILFTRWWYGSGWINSFDAITYRLKFVAEELSLGLLLRTLFEPWKQITLYAGPNTSIDVKLHVIFDNLFSRVFGFVIRSAVLIVGCIVITLMFIYGCFLAVAWPLIPFLPIGCIIMAVTQ